jgi:hypothetical protein
VKNQQLKNQQVKDPEAEDCEIWTDQRGLIRLRSHA